MQILFRIHRVNHAFVTGGDAQDVGCAWDIERHTGGDHDLVVLGGIPFGQCGTHGADHGLFKPILAA